MKDKFDKFMVSVYTKKKMEGEDYERIRLAFKESMKLEDTLRKYFATFSKVIFNEKVNRYCIFFDEIDENSYDSYIKVFMVETL